MKAVSYKDPYDKVPVVIQIEDDDSEGLEEVIHFLNDKTRVIENLEHKERYHIFMIYYQLENRISHLLC